MDKDKDRVVGAAADAKVALKLPVRAEIVCAQTVGIRLNTLLGSLAMKRSAPSVAPT